MKFWTDENFNGYILRGLLARLPDLDITRVQDTSLYQSDDETLLEAAAQAGAIIISHDKDTLIGFAYKRIEDELPMPGLIEITQGTPIGLAINDLVMLIGSSFPADFENRVWHIPLNW